MEVPEKPEPDVYAWTQQAAPPALREFKPHRGELTLIFGILGILVCAPLAIAAWILAHNDLDQIRAGIIDPRGEGLTTAGYWLGIVGTVLFALGALMGIVLMIVYFTVIAAMFTP